MKLQTPTKFTWKDFEYVEVLKNWASSIKACANENASLVDWKDASHAALIIGESADYADDILSCVAQEIGFDFVSINADDLEDMCKEGVDLVFKANTFIHLYEGTWLTCEPTFKSMERIQKQVRKLIKKFNPQAPIIVCASVKNYMSVDVQFRRAEYFNKRFYIPAPSFAHTGNRFIQLLGQDICDASLISYPEKVGKLFEDEYSDNRKLALFALGLQRLAVHEKRQIKFSDIVYMTLHGTVLSDFKPHSKRNLEVFSSHEAGHAVVAIIDSKSAHIPELISLVPSDAHQGIMVESYAYNLEKEDIVSYFDQRHRIRICLAGRAAEFLLLGLEITSINGAGRDLYNATYKCNQLFAEQGFTFDEENHVNLGENLLVYTHDNELMVPDYSKVEVQTKQYLRAQYEVVMQQLTANRELLHAIKHALKKHLVLTQEDLSKLCQNIKLVYANKHQ